MLDEAEFFRRWQVHGKRGGAEHQVYHDEHCGRWFKRLYHGVNQSTLGDYLIRMRLHEMLFPETAYRLEGFTLNPKSKEIAPVVSQPHVEVDTTRPLVSPQETDELMAALGFAPVQLLHEGIANNGYFAHLHPVTGVFAHDLPDEKEGNGDRKTVRLEQAGNKGIFPRVFNRSSVPHRLPIGSPLQSWPLESQLTERPLAGPWKRFILRWTSPSWSTLPEISLPRSFGEVREDRGAGYWGRGRNDHHGE